LNNYIKSVDVSPKEILAGDSVEFNIKIIAGPDFVSPKSRGILDLPGYLGYSRPTLRHQEKDGFIEVLCSNPDILYSKNIGTISEDKLVSPNLTGQSKWHRFFVLDFLGGHVKEDDEIIIKWGCTANGFGVGTKVTTLVLGKEFYNTIHLRYFTDYRLGFPEFARDLPDAKRQTPDCEIPLRYKLLPRDPEQIKIFRNKDKTRLGVYDRFSNICQLDSLEDFINEDCEAQSNDFGLFELKRPYANLSSSKLPVSEIPDMSNVYNNCNIYVGDMHTHSAFSCDCIEDEKQEMKPDKLMKFARDAACLDFLAVTDHHQPWDIPRRKLSEENWGSLLESVKAYNEPGKFLAFPGFKFRRKRCDVAVILNEKFSFDEINNPELKDIRALWDIFKGKDYITIPHFHDLGTLPEGEWHKCPYEGVETVMEIFSCHGSYESAFVLEQARVASKKFRKDRCANYFLKNNYKYGIVCNSDGHKGHVGYNGLTCVYAKELTNAAIIESIRKRNVYGTTNARIKLLLTVDGALMGSVVPLLSGKHEVYVSAAGEQKIKAVDLIKNGELCKRFRPDKKEFECSFSLEEKDPCYLYARITQVDNHIAYSSPIWVE
jgi:hypothetical protein